MNRPIHSGTPMMPARSPIVALAISAATMPPISPDQVFDGLIVGARRAPPKARPAK